MYVLLLLTTLVALCIGAPIQNNNETDSAFNQDLLFGDIRVPEGAKNAFIVGLTWENKQIPYVIDPAAGFTTAEKTAITKAMRAWEAQTGNCVKIVPRTNQASYVKIMNGDGCGTTVGRNSIDRQPQILTLQRPGCINDRAILHEFLHIAGFVHEQQRPDRDNYVKVNYPNLPTGDMTKYNMDKYLSNQIHNLNVGYDYMSIMHYTRQALSINGKDTISPLAGNTVDWNLLGTRSVMSWPDGIKLRRLYGCPD